MSTEAHARNADPETSHAAAAAIRLGDLENRVLHTLRAFPQGLTSIEIAAALDIGRDSVSPRMKKLVNANLVIDCGIRRASYPSRVKSIVWKAVQPLPVQGNLI